MDDPAALGDEALAELNERLTRDRGAIAAAFQPIGDLGPVMAIRSLGDSHRGGRRVAAVKFGGGLSVIYKPRPVGPERWWANLISWIEAGDGRLGGLAPAVLDQGGYGWVQRVAAAPAQDQAAARRRARHAGQLLALLDVFEVRDAHIDNLVFAGDRPVLVDAETIAHPRFGPWMEAESLVLTGFLPWNGLGPPGPSATAGILGAIGSMDPLDEADLVVEGYREGYGAVRRLRDQLGRDGGPLESLAEQMVRVVLRPTRQYAAGGGGAWSPRSSPMDIPLGARAEAVVLASERSAMARGDIPVFSARAGGRDLVTESGIVPDFFAESAVARIRRRLAVLGDHDRERNARQLRSIMLVAGLAAGTPAPRR